MKIVQCKNPAFAYRSLSFHRASNSSQRVSVTFACSTVEYWTVAVPPLGLGKIAMSSVALAGYSSCCSGTNVGITFALNIEIESGQIVLELDIITSESVYSPGVSAENVIESARLPDGGRYCGKLGIK